MENKINIAEILKDCPSGMELDCTIWDNVVFDHIDTTSNYPIYIKKMGGELEYLTEDGHFNFDCDAKCVIFPKGKTTWEGFIPPCMFKDGDIVISDMGDIHLLRTKDSSYCAYRKGKRILPEFDSTLTTNVTIVRLATEEEKEKLFKAIKANGYKWNEETKTLEKLPKFKVRDRIKYINGKNKDGVKEGIILSITNDTYDVAVTNDMGIFVPISEQDNWELVPNKFDINTLKPFESRVLVRDYDHQCWRVSFFGYFDKFMGKFDTVRGVYIQCIPYEGNEHLLNTNKDCDEYYKNW